MKMQKAEPAGKAAFPAGSAVLFALPTAGTPGLSYTPCFSALSGPFCACFAFRAALALCAASALFFARSRFLAVLSAKSSFWLFFRGAGATGAVGAAGTCSTTRISSGITLFGTMICMLKITFLIYFHSLSFELRTCSASSGAACARSLSSHSTRRATPGRIWLPARKFPENLSSIFCGVSSTSFWKNSCGRSCGRSWGRSCGANKVDYSKKD